MARFQRLFQGSSFQIRRATDDSGYDGAVRIKRSGEEKRLTMSDHAKSQTEGNCDHKALFVHSMIDDFKLSAAEFRIFCHLHRRQNPKTGTAWPSVDAMAQTCRLAKRTVTAAIQHLERHNMLDVIRRKGAKTQYVVKDRSADTKNWMAMPSEVCSVCCRTGAKKVTSKPKTSAKGVTVQCNPGNGSGANGITEGNPKKGIHEGDPKGHPYVLKTLKGVKHPGRWARSEIDLYDDDNHTPKYRTSGGAV